MFVVDTNILVYASDQDSPLHERCRVLVEQWRHQATPWYLTWGIVYEFLRVSTHPRVFRSPWVATDAWKFVEALLASPSLGILTPTDRHPTVAAGVIREIPHLSGNLLHDAQTAVLMREHGVKQIYTRDTDFHRFPFLSPIDPVGVTS